MTLTVTISIDKNEPYSAFIYPEILGMPAHNDLISGAKDRHIDPVQRPNFDQGQTINPGESCEFTIWKGKQLRIIELYG